MTGRLEGMQVLAYLPRLWPTWGAGTQRSTALATGLLRAGAQLTAIVPVGRPPTGPPPAELDGADLRFVFSPIARLPWQIVHVLRCAGMLDEHVIAHRRARREQGRWDAVVASGPPWSGAAAAADAARGAGAPLLVDLRDEWSTNPFQTKLGPLYHWRDRRLERRTLQQAHTLTAPYETPVTDLVAPVAARKVVIPHGADLRRIASSVGPPSADRPMRLLFAGARYGMVNEEPFLAALRRRPPAHPLELRLVGSDRPVSALAPPGVKVTVAGPIPHDRLMAEYDAAQALLALAPTKRGERWVPSKLPEYAATGRPVLAFGEPSSALLDAVKELPGGHVAPAGDDDALEAALESLANDVATGTDHRAARSLRSWEACGDDFARTVEEMIGTV